MAKPHLKLMKVLDLDLGTLVLWHGKLREIKTLRHFFSHVIVTYHDGEGVCICHEDKVYAETTFQANARPPCGRGDARASARARRRHGSAPGCVCDPRLDERESRAVGAEGKGCGAVSAADNVQGVRQPRVPVRMTSGHNLKPGDYIALKVFGSDTLMMADLPNGTRIMVNRSGMYLKVNPD